MRAIILACVAHALTPEQQVLLGRFADVYEEVCGTRGLGLSDYETLLAVDDPRRFLPSGRTTSASSLREERYNQLIFLPLTAYQSCGHVKKSLSRLRSSGDAFTLSLGLPPISQMTFRRLPKAITVFGFLPDQPDIACEGLDTSRLNQMLLQAKWVKDHHPIWVMHLYSLGSVYSYVLSTCGVQPALIAALSKYLSDALRVPLLLYGYSAGSAHNFFEDVAYPSHPGLQVLSFLESVRVTFPSVACDFLPASPPAAPAGATLRLAAVNDGKLAQDGCMLGSLLRWLSEEKVPVAVLSEGVACEGRLSAAVGEGWKMTNPARRGKDEEGSKGGGVGLIWSAELPVVDSVISVNAEDNVSISVLDLGNVKVVGMYLQPGSDKKMIATVMKAATKLHEVIGSGPAILTGDMNCEGGTRRRAVLDAAMHALGLTLLNRGQMTYFSRVSKIPRDLDLIYVTPGISIVDLQSFPKVRANDHDRVVATFSLPETESETELAETETVETELAETESSEAGTVVTELADSESADSEWSPKSEETESETESETETELETELMSEEKGEVSVAEIEAMGLKGVFLTPAENMDLALAARMMTEASRLQFTNESSNLSVFGLNLSRALDLSSLPGARLRRPAWPRKMQALLQLSLATAGLPAPTADIPSFLRTRALIWPEGLLVFSSSAAEMQESFTFIERILRNAGIIVSPEDVSHINYPDSLGSKLRLRTGETVSLSRWIPLPGRLRLTALPSRLDFTGEPDDMFKLWFKYNLHRRPITTEFRRAKLRHYLGEIIIPEAMLGFQPSLPSFMGYGRASNQVAAFIDGVQLNQSLLLPKQVMMVSTLDWVYRLVNTPGTARPEFHQYLVASAERVCELQRTTSARPVASERKRVLPQRAFSSTFFGVLSDNYLKPLNLTMAEMLGGGRSPVEWRALVGERVKELKEPIVQYQYGEDEEQPDF